MAINSINLISAIRPLNPTTQIDKLNSLKGSSEIGMSDFLTLIPPQQQTETKKQSFAEMLMQSVNNVTQTNNVTKLDATNLALDKIDDNLHNLQIDAMRAELALSSLISVRNKALEAYSEIMRITI